MGVHPSNGSLFIIMCWCLQIPWRETLIMLVMLGDTLIYHSVNLSQSTKIITIEMSDTHAHSIEEMCTQHPQHYLPHYRVHNYLLMDYDLSHVLFWQTNKIIFNTRTRTTSGQWYVLSDGMQHPVYSEYPPGPSKANKTNIPVWINRWAHPQALSGFYNVLPS